VKEKATKDLLCKICFGKLRNPGSGIEYGEGDRTVHHRINTGIKRGQVRGNCGRLVSTTSVCLIARLV
jgi:hypothetical protein